MMVIARDELKRAEGRLGEIIDAETVDRQAKSAERALIERHGGREAVLSEMLGFSCTPPPGIRWRDMEGNG